jgi:hypothetical protein
VSIRHVILVLLLAGTCSACSTTTLLKKQELAQLSSELDYLQATKTLLTKTPNPEISGDISIFVSVGTLNQILAAADNLAVAIPNVSGATLHIASVRTAFSDGLPIVKVVAWAEKPSARLRLDVSISAELEPVSAGGDPSTMQFRVGVREVVPVLHWGIFQLPSFIFVRQLMRVKAQEYADQLPAIVVPLRSDFDLKQAPASNAVVIATDNGAGHLYGTLSLPGYELSGSVIVDTVLFLHDGLHVLGHIQTPTMATH